MKFSKKDIFILLLFLFSVTAVLWPILFGNKFFIHTWATDESYPFNAYFDNHFDNHLPLWFTSHTHGFPAYLTQSGGFLHPLILLLFKIADYLTAYHFLIFFNLLVACVATYALARRMGMSRKAGVVSAFVFTFSHISIFAHTISLLGGMLVFLPILMLCVFEIYLAKTLSPTEHKSNLINWFVRKKRFWLVILTSIIMAAAWMTSYTEGILYVGVTCAAFAIFLDFLCYFKNKGIINFGKCFGTARATFVVIISSIFLSIPWILPVVNFLNETRRSMAPEGSILGVFLDPKFQLERIVQLFYPYLSIPYSEYIPHFSTGRISGFVYVGILPLILGIFAFLNLRKNKMSIFFVIFFGFTLLTLAPYIPLNWLIHKLPIFNLFRDGYKWIYVSIFIWAILSGFGFDAIKDIYKTKKIKQILRVFEIIFFAIFSLAIITNLIFVFFKDKIISFGQAYFSAMSAKNIGLSDAFSGVDLNYVYNLISQAVDKIEWNISFLNPHFFWAIFFILLSALLILLFRKSWISLPVFKLLVVVLIVSNFLILWQGFYKTAPAELILKPPATVEFLNSVKNEKGLFRVIKFPLFSRYNVDWGIDIDDYISRYEIDIALVNPNFGLLYDIDSIYGGDGFRPLRHERMTSYTIGGLSNDTETGLANEGIGYKMSIEDRIQVFNSPFSRNLLSMMNVRYILTTFNLPAPWELVFETTTTKNEIPVYIYENPDAMPRIYFAKDVKIIPVGINTAFDELKKIEDFRETTLIECDNTLCPMAAPQNVSSEDTLEIEKIDFDYLQLKTKTKTPRWLVYSQSNFPTWEVRVDGELTDIYTANYIYQGIFIPAGEHEIEFKYPGFMGQFFYALKSFIDRVL